MTHKILILNGPNLNMLGQREPDIYGGDSLDTIDSACQHKGQALGMAIDFRQSNSEGELVTWIQSAVVDFSGIVINGGAYSHTSIAILDALRAAGLPTIEVHLSNIYRRESFRKHSFISQAALGVICGLGAQGYLLALDALAQIVDKD
ncbi:MAG: type II 3-dehydroquinate dehydratase [Proteobacteria bacterium]|nr:type II 3-dehydroquinate dehydratase [Pseudomonadota bacterium]MDA1354976.1 type II 3-dehydroquinate dehydratase [Pseudomonadota bacterium]